MKHYQKIFYFTLAISVLVILIVAGKYLSILFLTVLGLWLGRNISENEKKVEAEIKTQHQKQNELFARTEELKDQYVQLKKSSETRRKGRNTTVLLLLIILLSFIIMNPKAIRAADNLYIPESYEELRELYILVDREVSERDELISQYQELIVDYENMIRDLNLMVQRLQQINSEKDLVIALNNEINVLQKRSTWGVTAGLNVGNGLGYNLGVVRVRGTWGWQFNYSPSGMLSLGLCIYL